ncbi:ROK family protein [Listeria aquatica]|uniref:ROK family protein n=1 Tax=Listeria aquatica TaxID=1494960 RepID=UPI003F70C303
MSNILVFDVGGTFVKYALVQNGKLGNVNKFKTPKFKEQFRQEMVEILHNVPCALSGVSISMPGVINPETGFALHGGSLQFIHKENLLELFNSYFDLPVAVHNDAKAAIIGEMNEGQLKNIQNGAMFVLGTGVGGSIMLNRKVLSGTHQSAGELSLLKTSTDLEKADFLVTRNGIQALLRPFAEAKQLDLKQLSGELFFEALQNGDPDAISIMQRFTDSLAVQIWNLQATLDLDKIVIGGGISSQPLLLDYIQASLKKLILPLSHLGDTILETIQPCVELSSLGNNANLLGAYYHFKVTHSK